MTTKTPKKPVPEDWHPRAVQGALEDAGYTLASLARKYGLTNSSYFSRVIRHGGAVGERRIAEALGLHPKDIWPSRYFDDGTRKPSGFHALYQGSRKPLPRNGNKQVAA